MLSGRRFNDDEDNDSDLYDATTTETPSHPITQKRKAVTEMEDQPDTKKLIYSHSGGSGSVGQDDLVSLKEHYQELRALRRRRHTERRATACAAAKDMARIKRPGAQVDPSLLRGILFSLRDEIHSTAAVRAIPAGIMDIIASYAVSSTIACLASDDLSFIQWCYKMEILKRPFSSQFARAIMGKIVVDFALDRWNKYPGDDGVLRAVEWLSWLHSLGLTWDDLQRCSRRAFPPRRAMRWNVPGALRGNELPGWGNATFGYAAMAGNEFPGWGKLTFGRGLSKPTFRQRKPNETRKERREIMKLRRPARVAWAEQQELKNSTRTSGGIIVLGSYQSPNNKTPRAKHRLRRLFFLRPKHNDLRCVLRETPAIFQYRVLDLWPEAFPQPDFRNHAEAERFTANIRRARTAMINTVRFNATVEWSD